MRPDHRSSEAQAYRHLYNTARWKRRRASQLQAEPLCRMCKAVKIYTAATVADHVTPHKGDEALFFEGDLQSLCKSHHDSAKQSEEKRGYVIGCGSDGRPLDPRHPWAKKATSTGV